VQRRHLLGAAVAAGLPFTTLAAGYPDRPVRLICPYAAGGGPDLLCRELAPLLGEALGQSVYVENKVGAGGVLAAQYLVGQPADGYTLMLASNAHLIQKLLQPALRFDALRDFAHVSLVSTSCCALLVAKDRPWQSVRALVQEARQRPGQLNYGSGGIGTPAHLAGASLAVLGDFKAVHVPLRGSVDIGLSLMRGDTHFAFPNLTTAQQAMKTGKLRMLAVTSAHRLEVLPDVPTLAENLGSDKAVQESWSGIWVHASTPQATVAALHDATVRAVQQPRMAAYANANGAERATSRSPEEFSRFVRAENGKLAEIIAMSHVRAA
jgi:tripartite-type tricarboxylate transporter receptor subunit TctC